jgi:CheY-like chemotaxis protein
VLMPREDGWEFLLSLRSHHETSAIPIIVCSVLGGSQLALSLGAAAYLPKPVSEQALLHTLAAWG